MKTLFIGLWVGLSCLGQSAMAWSTKEHVLITRVAVRELLADPGTPPAMKQWLRDAQPQLGTPEDERRFLLSGRMGIYPRGVDGLAFWSVMPDLLADAGDGRPAAPYRVPEQNLHYIDLELLNSDPGRQNFVPDLSHKPRLADIPRDLSDSRWTKAGMLPFRIQEMHERLISSLKAGRLDDKPGQYPRDEHAARYAGFLAHYAADNCQPMHATVDYQAYSFFPNAPKKPKVHFDMEYRLTDDEKEDYPELRRQFWDAFTADLASTPLPAIQDDLWTTSLKISMSAYDRLPLIGQAAKAAYLDNNGALRGFDATAFFTYSNPADPTKTTLLHLKAQMMANACKWIQTLWLDAWKQSHQADPK